jgi:hypothetical protein
VEGVTLLAGQYEMSSQGQFATRKRTAAAERELTYLSLITDVCSGQAGSDPGQLLVAEHVRCPHPCTNKASPMSDGYF